MITVSLNPRGLEESLDPCKIVYTDEFYLLENLTARLVSLSEDGSYNLELASYIKEINPTELEISIKNASFSNGEPIKLIDVKKTIERVVSMGAAHANLNEIISSITIHEDKLRIKLSQPTKSFLYYLSLPDMGILHESQYNKEDLKAVDFTKVSSGPYHYEKNGNDFFLKKNKSFSLARTNYPETVKLINSFGTDVVKLALNNDLALGQASLGSFIDNLPEIKKNKNLKFLGVPSDSLTYIFFNKHSSAFKNIEVRRWIANVIQNRITIPVEYENITRKTNQYFPIESKAALDEEEVKSLQRKFLPAKRPANVPQTITIHTYTTAYNVTLKKLIDQLTETTDFKVIIKNDIKPSEMLEKLKGNDIDLFLNIMSTDFRTPVEALNYEYFSNESNLQDLSGNIKKLFNSYQNTENPNEEEKFLKDITRQMIKDSTFIPLFHLAIPFFYNTEMVNADGLSHLFLFNFWKLKAQ